MQFSLLFCLKEGVKYIWNSSFFVLFRFLCLLILFLFSVFTLNKDRSYALLDESLGKNIIATSFTKLVIIQTKYTSIHLIDIQRA